MTNTSQSYNLSYGYLWWLNGKASYMAPGPQVVTPGELIPNAPPDMICGLGKDDQKIYVIPSTGMVIVRMGNAADSVTDASSAFDNQLWGYIDSLTCTPNGIRVSASNELFRIYPNPVDDVLYIQGATIRAGEIVLYDLLGRVVAAYPPADHINISSLPSGVYALRLLDEQGRSMGMSKVAKE
jgi:CubicO group peptidase (beta-lactamase class C family)